MAETATAVLPRQKVRMKITLSKRTKKPPGAHTITRYLKSSGKRDRYDIRSAIVIEKDFLEMKKKEFSIKEVADYFLAGGDPHRELRPLNLRCANFYVNHPQLFPHYWEQHRLVFIDEIITMQNGDKCFVSVGHSKIPGHSLELLLIPSDEKFQDHYVIPCFDDEE